MNAPKSPIILRKGIKHKRDIYEQASDTVFIYTLQVFHLIFENVMEYWGYKIAVTNIRYLIKLMSSAC